MSTVWKELKEAISTKCFLRFGSLAKLLDTFDDVNEELLDEEDFPSKEVYSSYQNWFWEKKWKDLDNHPVMYCYIWNELPESVKNLVRKDPTFETLGMNKDPLELWKLVHKLMNQFPITQLETSGDEYSYLEMHNEKGFDFEWDGSSKETRMEMKEIDNPKGHHQLESVDIRVQKYSYAHSTNIVVTKPRKKRVEFTDIEKSCIQSGVQLYGEGQWVTIKYSFLEHLRNRSECDIKDCWRNMKKKENRINALKNK